MSADGTATDPRRAKDSEEPEKKRRSLRSTRQSRAVNRAERERDAARREALSAATPYLASVRAPRVPLPAREISHQIVVATYNVHRWTAMGGGREPDPARAGFVISEIGADIVALQEVLRPFDAPDPLERIADALQLHLVFVATRVHRRGEVGNAILSRWPITSVFTLDLSFSRVERRSAVVAQFSGSDTSLSVVATHLALVDRTRRRQVRSILEHPRLQGPVVLLGDMNAWRNCEATRTLEQELVGGREITWPRTFPATRPVLSLDRIYARGGRVSQIRAHVSAAARRASDHLPVVARLDIPVGAG